MVLSVEGRRGEQLGPPAGRMTGQASSATGFSSAPILSISILTTSPAASQRGGALAKPTAGRGPLPMTTPAPGREAGDHGSLRSPPLEDRSSVGTSSRRSP